MEEVFQNFEHYKQWISKHWETNRILDSVLIERGLMIERSVILNGEAYRMLTKDEFDHINDQSFIAIPRLLPESNQF